MMKNKETLLIVGGVVLVILAVVLTIVFLRRNKKKALQSIVYPLTGLVSPLLKKLGPPLGVHFPLTDLDPDTNLIPGCTFCGLVNQQGGMVQFCPAGVLPASATRKIPAGGSLISNYRLTSDPADPDYNYKGQGFWWRQGATGCSG